MTRKSQPSKSTGSPATTGVQAAPPAIPVAPPRESVNDGRWVLERPLSPRGNTFLAIGPGQDEVVVKLAPDPGDRYLSELVRQELMTLSDVVHTHIERVLGYGVELDGVPWFAVEPLDGATLLDSTAPLRGATADVDDKIPAPIADFGVLAEVWAQVCRALQHLHARGIVHGDVTASNILVCPLPDTTGSTRHRAVLVDLGLAQPEHRVLRAGEVRGTPGYLAPELLIGAPPTRQTDLYALGVAMHLAITGTPPFRATDFDGLMAEQRVGLPLDFVVRHPGVPLGFEAVMRRCLAPDPAARPHSANEVIRELNGYLGTLHAEEPPPVAGRGAAWGRPPLTGRQADVDALRRAASPRAEGPPALLLAGPGGVGRTRLLEQLQVRCELDGIAVARGTARPRDVRPLGVLGELIGQVARRLGPEFRARHGMLLAEVALGHDRPTIPDEPAEAADARAERLTTAAFDAAAGRDWVFVIDDAESLSESHLAALGHLLRGLAHPAVLRGGPAPRLRCVLGWRTAQGNTVSLPEALTEPEPLTAEVRLAPLATDDARALFDWALHGVEVPPAVAEKLPPQEPSTPRAVLARARSLFERRVLADGDGAWRVDPDALAAWRPPRRDTDALDREVVGLKPGVRQMLTACAVFERPVPVGVLLAMSRRDVPAAAESLHALTRRGLVELIADEGLRCVALAHPADAGALLRGHPVDARPALARRALDALQRHPAGQLPPFWDELARLAIESCDSSVAPGLALDAAAHLCATGRLPAARELLDGGLSCMTSRDHRRVELEHAAFAIEVFQGKLDDARARLARLGKPRDRAAGARRLLLLARLAAAQDRGAEVEAAVAAGLPLAADGAPVVAAALHERRAYVRIGTGAIDDARKALAKADALLAGQTGPEAEGVRDDADMRRAMIENLLGRRPEAVALLRTVAERATARGDSLRAYNARGNLGLVLRDAGRFAEAADEARHGLEAAGRGGSATHRAQALADLGNVEDDLGEMPAAQVHLREAASLQARLGRGLQSSFALHNLGYVLAHMGELGEAMRVLTLALARRLKLGGSHPWAAHTATQLVRFAADAGNVDDAEGMLARFDGEWREHREHPLVVAWLHGARASLFEAQGRRDEAIAEWTEAAERSDFRAQGLSSLFDAHAAILLVQRGDVAKARALLADRPPAAEWEDRVSMGWARTAVALAEADLDGARAHLAGARAALPAQSRGDWISDGAYWEGRVAEAAGDWAAADEAYSRGWDRARATARLAGGYEFQAMFLANPRRDEIRYRADQARRRRQALAPDRAGDLTADELARLSACTRALGEELRLEPLLDRILDEAIALTGAVRAFMIVRVPAGEARDTLDAGALTFHAARRAGGEPVSAPEREVSTSIARQAMTEGAVLCTADAGGDPRFQPFISVHRLQLRSVLCQPLTLAGEGGAVGCLYLDHPYAAGAFGAHAQSLVAAFAAHVAVAVHAAQVVAERDAALAEAQRLRAKLEDTLTLRDAQLKIAIATGGDAAGGPDGLDGGVHGLVGASAPMRELGRLVGKFAASDLPVTILGESGTGKELVARALHARSARAEGPLVSENIGALSSALAAAELFGHVRGAFSGADRDRPGLFQLARGGTLFLDEVGELDGDAQVALLRAIDQREVRPVGATAAEPIDVRVICATNRDLAADVAAGRFRADLWYRLGVLVLRCPPLRDRLEDVPGLVQHLRARIARERGRCPELVPSALQLLTEHPWPGNVRQLENELRRAAVLAGGGPIQPSHFSAEVRREAATAAGDPTFDDARRRGFWPALAEVEARLLRQAVDAARGNQTEAARLIQMDRVTLLRKTQALGLAGAVPKPHRGRPKGSPNRE